MAPAIERMDNLDIVCDDLPAMVRFYHETLGLPLRFPYEAGQEWAALDAGNMRIFLLVGNGDQPAPRRPATKSEAPPGLDSLGFAVDDLDAAIAELDGSVEWAAEPREWRHRSGTWYRFRAFYDPAGNLLSVTEPHESP